MKMRPSRVILLIMSLFLSSTRAFSQDPNFYIFLCFGQSNMEGQGAIQTQDLTVDSRFQVMETIDCSNLGRTKGQWYTAVPPLCRCTTGLCPADYFGRTLVANLPSDIRVGVINVSVAGCAIELFQKDNYQAYAATAPSWMVSIINQYGGNPYQYLVDLAKMAQKDGVIKGILLHQGESNVGDNAWPSKVKGIYDSLINDLSLSPDSVPLLAGEVVNADEGGACASMNSIIDQLPQTLPNSYVISSSGCTDTTDNLHFNSAGYRKLGERYGMKMLSLLGYDPNTYLESECAVVGGDWETAIDTLASNSCYAMVRPGLTSASVPPSGDSSNIFSPFTVYGDSTFYIFARLNCLPRTTNSLWVKMDNGNPVKCSLSTTSGWQWEKLGSYDLSKGDHAFIIAYCEGSPRLDKICVSRYDYTPAGIGGIAQNLCTPVPTTGAISSNDPVSGYILDQNYPNPFNPSTTITFTLREKSLVTLKIFDALGREVADLISGEMLPGTYSRQWNAKGMPSGAYFCRLQAGSFAGTKKLVLLR